MQKIYFDMDGTIADFYGVEGWLNYLKEQNPLPYEIAKPLINMQRLARKLNSLQKAGYQICILSWLAKTSTPTYDELVKQAKLKWLATHLASVEFNEIHIVAYGTPKHSIGEGILFDDETQNREGWGEGAYTPDEIFEILRKLA